jgi:uncharacterized protein (DUF2342 family)
MAGYYNPNFGQDYLASLNIGPQYLNTIEKNRQHQGIAPPSNQSIYSVPPQNTASAQPNTTDSLAQSASSAMAPYAKPFSDMQSGLSDIGSQITNGLADMGGSILDAVTALF